MVTGASGRNWASYGADVVLPEGFDAADRALLTDPQTSGGLLVACAPAAVTSPTTAARSNPSAANTASTSATAAGAAHGARLARTSANERASASPGRLHDTGALRLRPAARALHQKMGVAPRRTHLRTR